MNSDKKIHIDKFGPHEQDAVMHTDGICRCICCGTHGNTNSYLKIYVENNDDMKRYKIRKLTPKECFRFMGVSEDDINTLLNSGISDAQLYRMAGNSIVVDCMTHIFDSLFFKEYEPKETSLW